ncbi:PAS domain-containing protein [Nocardiopsis sp. CNR-923]|uniref:PAS domain-containing protein n=1 Tax=Nocardiopsis sp. CNR-923 TaxID=1904965 RepID=UPI0021CC51E5|nr:PAS domain-containing protein [Nocardiopsis sp. CNR-923]
MDREGAASVEPTFLTLDGRGVVTAWSTGAHRVLGYEPGEVVGHPAADLLAGDPAPPLPWDREGPGPWNGRIAVRRKDGRTHDLRMSAYPTFDAVGGGGWLLTFDGPRPTADHGTDDSEPDVGVLKRWALEQIPLPMALFDRRGATIAANPATERAMGLSERELLGPSAGERAPGPGVEGLARIPEFVDRVLNAGEEVLYETSLRTPGEAREHAWLLTLYPVRDQSGRVRAMSMAAMDATAQFLARHRLGILNDAGFRIGTALNVARTADELTVIATDHFADLAIVDLLDGVLHGDEPIPGPPGEHPLFRRAAQRSVLHGCPEAVVRVGTAYTYPEGSPPALALASGQASLHRVDEQNLTWWASGSPARARSIRDHGIHSLLVVPVRARSLTLGVAIFARHRTADPFDEDDLLLAREVVARAALSMDNARRYTNERATALALQRSLLPRRVPRSGPWTWRPAMCPRVPMPGSAATGSTSSRCRGRGWRSWWVTWSVTASTPPPPWAGCARRCAHWPTWT